MSHVKASGRGSTRWPLLLRGTIAFGSAAVVNACDTPTWALSTLLEVFCVEVFCVEVFCVEVFCVEMFCVEVFCVAFILASRDAMAMNG